MPRIPRGFVDGCFYHVLNRGNAGQQVFHTEEDYRHFISLMKEAKERFPVKLFAYCLMPNHFHMVVQPDRGEELSRWMHWLMTSHVRHYHRLYQTSGHVWQGRFKSFLVQGDRYLLAVLRYVEGNPVRAGLVKAAGDWPWSSHGERLGSSSQFRLMDAPPLDLPPDWDEFVSRPLLEKELARIRQNILRQAPYGDTDWCLAVAREVGLESTLRPRGRPRKNSGA